MKKLIFLFLLCISVFANGYSQTKQESIKELMHLMKTDSMMTKMIDQMMPVMLNQMQSQMKDSTAKAQSQEIMDIAKRTVVEMTPKIMSQTTLIYDKYYTESEIKDFITFYKTPTGQKSINTMPEMMKDMMGNMMKNTIPDMAKEIAAKMLELKKKDSKK